jgi:hypothetical protein
MKALSFEIITVAHRDILPVALRCRRILGQFMSLVTELERLADALSDGTAEAPPLAWTSVADRIAKNLGVKNDGVGILGLSIKWRHLYFLAPEALKNVGFIPLSSNTALAARTARESRPEIDNSFANARHATVFESVKTVPGALGEAIQKIMSAPILAADKVVGDIHNNPKGTNAATAGPDFTPGDLGKLLALSKPLGKLLQHVARD